MLDKDLVQVVLLDRQVGIMLVLAVKEAQEDQVEDMKVAVIVEEQEALAAMEAAQVEVVVDIQADKRVRQDLAVDQVEDLEVNTLPVMLEVLIPLNITFYCIKSEYRKQFPL